MLIKSTNGNMKVSQYDFGWKFRPEALLRNLHLFVSDYFTDCYCSNKKCKLRLSILKKYPDSF